MKNLTKVIDSALIVASVFALSPIGAKAESTLSIEQAKNFIITQGGVFWGAEELNNIKFIEEVSPQGNNVMFSSLIDNSENLYEFAPSSNYPWKYFIGKSSGKIYFYEGGNARGSFSCVQNNTITHKWYWQNGLLNTNGGIWIECKGWDNRNTGEWQYYYSDGKQAIGWFQDRDGKWYYFDKYGTMLRNETIDGYRLGADGAWVKDSVTKSEAENIVKQYFINKGKHIPECISVELEKADSWGVHCYDPKKYADGTSSLGTVYGWFWVNKNTGKF